MFKFIKWALLGGTLLAILCFVVPFLFIWLVSLVSTKEPLQDTPIQEREWNQLQIQLVHDHQFQDGAPGSVKAYLYVRATPAVALCDEKRFDEISKKALKTSVAADKVSLELFPALTGGKCGRKGFESTYLPSDPRQTHIDISGAIDHPITVEIKQKAGTVSFQVRVTPETLEIAQVNDPAQLAKIPAPKMARLPQRMVIIIWGSETPVSIPNGTIEGQGNLGFHTPDGQTVDPAFDVVQYCLAPKPFKFAGGQEVTWHGKTVRYEAGVSPLSLEELKAAVAKENPGKALTGLTFKEWTMDGKTREIH